MTEAPIVDALLQMGPPGILAGGMFWFYVKRENEHARELKAQTDLVVALVKDLSQVTRDNTAAFVALKTFLEERERRR